MANYERKSAYRENAFKNGQSASSNVADIIVAIALNVGFHLFYPENCLSGHDKIADVESRLAAQYGPPVSVKPLGDEDLLKKITCLLLGFAAISQLASAQTDEAGSANSDLWMIYERVASDGKPLVIVARTGNSRVQSLLLNGRATVVNCRADSANVNDQGMPQGTDRLYSIEDKLDEEPTLLAMGAIRAASVTGQGQRRMYLVHRDPLDLTPFLQAGQVQDFACDASEVGDRKSLISLVTPTPLEIQLNGDQEVIANLQNGGDDGHKARKTSFWFYGRRGSLDAVAANLKAYGFSVDHWLNAPTGVVLSRTMPVDFTAFQALTPVIVSIAERSGIQYDGWETMVISKASTRPGGTKDH